MRDLASIEGQLTALARLHPQHARLVDVGDSTLRVRDPARGADVLALVLGSYPDDPNVPRIHVTAGVHPRESANPALLLEWSRRTLQAARDGDPARRALLDNRTVIVVPVVNPDTHTSVVAGFDRRDPSAIWRRGNHREGGGVDLNRNFDNRWGAGSVDPGSKNYRGPFPASEPEVQAIQGLGRLLRPAAVYDIHSPGGVVLMPRGAPDARAAAELVSRASGYAISTSDAHWKNPVGGGTVKDWSHDQLGAVSLTIETGSVHHQDDVQYADTLARMLPTLDALVATVDGRHEVPAAARGLATPSLAPRFVAPAAPDSSGQVDAQ